MKIKMLVMDVDGTLTDGCIHMGPDGETEKAFHAHDGYGIAQILPKYGIAPVIITGRASRIVERRAEELKITHLYQGVSDKLARLQQVAAELVAAPEEIAYIGDDLNDLDCIRWCGVTACPADAIRQVRDAAGYICQRDGGRGAVREFIDRIVEMIENG